MRGKRSDVQAIPAAGVGKRGEQGHLGYLLRQAHSAHRARMERSLQGLGVTVPQFSVLTMLGAYPGASGADLARLALLTPQTMSVIVNNLQKLGAISRRPHEEHGRIQAIELTAVGRDLLMCCKKAVRSAEDALAHGIDPVDERALRRWLVNVAKLP